jgi:hypothetical protein
MNARILLLLLLGISFLFFGCAKKGDAATEVTEEPGEAPEEGGDKAEEVADLFQIDTDKPLGDEGLDMDSPSAKK